jgi:hypothetical protein
MANTATNINELISNYADGFTDKELLRLSNDGAYRLFLDDAALISRGSGILSPSALNDVEQGAYSPNGAAIPILKNAGVVVNSTPTTLCDTTAINGDTVKLAVAYQDVSFSIKSYYSYGNYNNVGRQADIMRQIKEAVKTIRTTFATACEGALDTNKNQQQINPYLFGYFTDSGADEFQIDPAKQDFMYNKIHGQFDRMDFADMQKRALGNPEHAAVVRELYAQGGANDENTQFQFRGAMPPEFLAEEGFNSDVMFYRDNVITNGAGVEQSFYVLPVGSVAIVHANDVQKYDQGNLPNGTSLETQILPGLPEVVWGLRKTYGCDDNDLDYEQWQLESRYAIFTPYVEDLTTDLTGVNKYVVAP